MTINDLVGSWTAESGDSHLELKADGTYIRVSSVEMPMTFETIALDDEGTYTADDGTVTFTPTSGHYRRNGVDEGFDSKVRRAPFRFEPNRDRAGSDLVLDDNRYSKE
jgi:hypothetical protein